MGLPFDLVAWPYGDDASEVAAVLLGEQKESRDFLSHCDGWAVRSWCVHGGKGVERGERWGYILWDVGSSLVPPAGKFSNPDPPVIDLSSDVDDESLSSDDSDESSSSDDDDKSSAIFAIPLAVIRPAVVDSSEGLSAKSSSGSSSSGLFILLTYFSQFLYLFASSFIF